MLYPRRELRNVFKIRRERKCEAEILYSAHLTLRNKGHKLSANKHSGNNTDVLEVLKAWFQTTAIKQI